MFVEDSGAVSGSGRKSGAMALSPGRSSRHDPRMKWSLTEALCTRCGLCCDGSLFADVELAGRGEATRLEAMGMEIEDEDGSGALLLQPCLALKSKRCTIYAHRPECCRTFECRLLQDVRRGAVDVERAKERIAEALKRIERLRDLMAQVGQHDGRLPLMESCAEALAKDADSDPKVNRRRAELEAAMSDVKELIQKSFLAEARPAPARR